MKSAVNQTYSLWSSGTNAALSHLWCAANLTLVSASRTAVKKISQTNPGLPAAAVASAPDNEMRTLTELRSVVWEFWPAWDESWELCHCSVQTGLEQEGLLTGQTIPVLQHETEKIQGQAIPWHKEQAALGRQWHTERWQSHLFLAPQSPQTLMSQGHVHGDYLCFSPDSIEHNQLSENLEFEAHKQMWSGKKSRLCPCIFHLERTWTWQTKPCKTGKTPAAWGGPLQFKKSFSLQVLGDECSS